jgi:ATP-binding cassette subfamily B (MDR/TAP) protein 1
METEKIQNSKDVHPEHPELAVLNEKSNQIQDVPSNKEKDKNVVMNGQDIKIIDADDELEVQDTFPPISYFRLQYQCAETTDYIYLIIGFIGSMGMGCSMPLFSLIFGNTINNFGPATNPLDFIDRINKMVLNFVYCALGVFLASFLMITFFTINGKRTVWKLKGLYFEVIMKQEQGYFDKNNPYKYATKVQNQTKTIESGVFKL